MKIILVLALIFCVAAFEIPSYVPARTEIRWGWDPDTYQNITMQLLLFNEVFVIASIPNINYYNNFGFEAKLISIDPIPEIYRPPVEEYVNISVLYDAVAGVARFTMYPNGTFAIGSVSGGNIPAWGNFDSTAFNIGYYK